MAARARSLLDVLSRRNQIETELRNLVINRNLDDTATNKPTYYVKNTNPPLTDSSKTKNQPVTTNINQPKDSTGNKPATKINSPYTFVAGDPHYAVLVFNKVDPVFINEAKNAFTRFNKEVFYNKTYNVDLADFDTENKFLFISPFKDAADATNYIDQTKPRTASEIIPWLKGGKYYFIILSDKNYELLKANKDLGNYKAFLNQYLPGKF
jgi:uncharacterized membrane protein